MTDDAAWLHPLALDGISARIRTLSTLSDP
jgi:hypothetical protein